MSRTTLFVVLSSLLLAGIIGCMSPKAEPVMPVTQLNELSPELQGLTDAAIETYLKANVTVRFPTVVAVGRLENDYDDLRTDYIRGTEAEGWKGLASLRAGSGEPLVNQVQLISPMLSGRKPTLKTLRNAAALLHAPVLLIYIQMEDWEERQNSAAMAYWTIVGLFTVPGTTVERNSLCHALLIDTQSGAVIATIQGEAKQAENVLPGAAEVARDRQRVAVPAQAMADLQKNVSELIVTLAQKPEDNGAVGKSK